jgi:hypothetical protein
LWLGPASDEELLNLDPLLLTQLASHPENMPWWCSGSNPSEASYTHPSFQKAFFPTEQKKGPFCLQPCAAVGIDEKAL